MMSVGTEYALYFAGGVRSLALIDWWRFSMTKPLSGVVACVVLTGRESELQRKYSSEICKNNGLELIELEGEGFEQEVAKSDATINYYCKEWKLEIFKRFCNENALTAIIPAVKRDSSMELVEKVEIDGFDKPVWRPIVNISESLLRNRTKHRWNNPQYGRNLDYRVIVGCQNCVMCDKSGKLLADNLTCPSIYSICE